MQPFGATFDHVLLCRFYDLFLVFLVGVATEFEFLYDFDIVLFLEIKVLVLVAGHLRNFVRNHAVEVIIIAYIDLLVLLLDDFLVVLVIFVVFFINLQQNRRTGLRIEFAKEFRQSIQ